MMGSAQRLEPKLFYTSFNLNERVPPEHPLREVAAAIDFSFVRKEVAELYGRVGNPSIDPTVLLKLMFLLFYENVRSERALAEQLPMRLDWLWFCGFDLDSDLPNHSVLSKARRRWGPELFGRFFERVLQQCVGANLVDGRVVYVDGSVISADASPQTLHVHLQMQSEALYEQLDGATEPTPASPPSADSSDVPHDEQRDSRMAEPNAAEATDNNGDGDGDDDDAVSAEPGERLACRRPQPSDDDNAASPKLGERISSTDPDARLTRKNKRTILGYKDHRVVDDRYGIITATLTTDAATAEADRLLEVLDIHEYLLGATPNTVVADKGYGTGEIYQKLQEKQITPCIPHKKVTEARDDRFPRSAFTYDAEGDCFHCPAGQKLTRRGEASHGRYRYRAEGGVCQSCELREQCTASQQGRLLSRHVNQDAIDWADNCNSRGHRRRLMSRRKSLGEGSFADAAHRHGYKRMRWRETWRCTIQNLMIAATQNIRKLIRYARPAVPKACATAIFAPHAAVFACALAANPSSPLTRPPITLT